ncbi:MAG: YlxR family protein [Defluviitaleaceae bacterium]|nr:YlxR family protein [Defluviitaleaceae bacterium]
MTSMMKPKPKAQTGKTPQRRCVGCREKKDKAILVRIVFSGGVLAIDRSAKASGRGVYVCRSIACLTKAQKSKGLERSMKCSFQPEIYVQLIHLYKAEVER